PAHPDHDFRTLGATNAALHPASTNHPKILRRKVRPLTPHDARKGFHPRKDSLHGRIGQRLHLGLAPSEKCRACRWRLGAQPSYDFGWRRQILGLDESLLIAFDKSIKQRVTLLFPGTLARCEIDRAQEPLDIDNGRASSGVVEVIEPPCILHNRELFDMRVAVQAHKWQF